MIAALCTAFALALAVAALATPLVIWTARKRGWVVEPREDRWHRKPTAVFGGVAIYAALAAAWLAMGPRGLEGWTIFCGASAMFLLGLVDDARELRPQVKFLGQLLVAIGAVSAGIRIGDELIPWPWVSIPLSVFWLVGITNAVNILDNMDGLSSGVVCSASLVLAAASVVHNGGEGGMAAAILAGAAAGFLIYNFNPAKIFMGDCGSLMLGFTLASASILTSHSAGPASQVIMAVLVPVGALVVPIFDTTLVSFERTSHGRSIAQGGRDHSSHRLVFLGLSERRAVLLLLAISLGGGLGSLALGQFASPLTALVVVALVAVGLVFFGVFLGDVKVYDAKAPAQERWKSPILGRVFLFKRQILQIVVDVVLFSASYTAAYLLRFESDFQGYLVEIVAESLPFVLATKMIAMWTFGVYRGDWRYVSVSDMIRLGKACVLGTLLSVLAVVIVYRFEWYSRAVIIIDLVLSFLLVAGSRTLIRVFRESVRLKKGVPVLLMGAGDGGAMLIRELKNSPQLGYVPVGFVDDDPAKKGQVIHGITVLGDRHDIPRLAAEHGVETVFIAILSAPADGFADVFQSCEKLGLNCSRIQPIIKLDA